jgi:hypothetical protein
MTKSSNTLSESANSDSWKHMKSFWETLSEDQKSTINGALDAGAVSPEVTNSAGQRAYIDDIQLDGDGELRIIGQLV